MPILGRRDRVTFLDVLRATRKVTAAQKFADKDELMVAVAEEIMGCKMDNANEFGWDINSILEAIAKWLPIIMQLLALFA
jgi:hypothetical protein